MPTETRRTPTELRPDQPGAPRRPGEDFAALFPELYRSAFTAAQAELGSRVAAQDVTEQTLARAYARWSRIEDAPVSWVSMAARNQALESIQRRPPGRDVLLDEETELEPGEIVQPAPGALAAARRRGTWLRRRRAASWAGAGVCVLTAAALAIGLGNSMPPARPTIATPGPSVITMQPGADYTPITATAWKSPGLRFGRISAGRSEQGSVRVRFEGYAYQHRSGRITATVPDGPAQQLVIDPEAPLLAVTRVGKGLQESTFYTPERLIQTLNRSMPGGQAFVWVRLSPDGKISALRQE